ncbi:hypothetical protein ACSBLW_00445 [Thioclava sp. FR2]
MTILFLRRPDMDRRRILRDVPRNLSPRLMRDIGLDPWPECPRLPFYSLW